MAPLMLLLLERLVEEQLDKSELSTETTQEKVSTGSIAPGYAETSQGSKPIPSGMPVTGGRLTQNYHSGHNGLDFGVVVGTPVKTTMDGKVIHAGWNNQGYGNLVIVENGEYRTYYAHLSSIPVSVGDTVRAGTTIGLSGNTGNSTGPHLHYEIRKDKVAINPTAATLGTGA
jgi:murein DD-endopeptidase MepM/ murein hydrolase activator NlpD